MTRDEVKKIVMVMSASYPNFKPTDLTSTVNVWTEMLEEYNGIDIAVALKAYITSDTSGFAPSMGQLIDKLRMITKTEEMSELEAWNIVYKAIGNSGYNSESEFEKLPEACKKAVGNHANLKEWSMMDMGTVQSVEQSHFIRNYRTIAKRMSDAEKMPQSIRVMIENTRELKKEIAEIEAIEEIEHIPVAMPEHLKEQYDKLF